MPFRAIIKILGQILRGSCVVGQFSFSQAFQLLKRGPIVVVDGLELESYTDGSPSTENVSAHILENGMKSADDAMVKAV